MCITVGAIGTVAEKILKCSVKHLESVINQGLEFDLEPVKTELQDKMYLVLLRRTYSKRSESQKRLLMVSFLDDTVPSESSSAGNTNEHSYSSPSRIAELDTEPNVAATSLVLPTVVEEYSGSSLKISPLKRQLESVTIKSASPLKKALFQDANDEVPAACTEPDTAQQGPPSPKAT